MREIPEGLAAHLQQGATTLCRCWSLTRRDGVVLGFTDHDRALAFDEIGFAAVTGLEAAESASELGFAIGGGEVAGAFAATGLNEADLARGLYDDARVSVWLVNWADVEQRMLLEVGFVGEVKRGDSGFTAEVRGLAKAFDEERGRLYMRACSADLGDARCGVAVAPVEGTVASSDGRIGLTATTLSAYVDGHFTGGRLVFTGGGNIGFATEIKRHAARDGEVAFQLWQAAPQPIVPGDAFTVTPGCDKSFATCRTKFANGINFRGFPHIPGNDFIIGGVRPGDGLLDGGSLFR
jgi:uncharacterized phage protein (TIGR02218 family)